MWQYWDGILKMVKMLSGQSCTLLTLNSRHLAYVTEGEASPTYFQAVGGGRAAATDADVIPMSCELSMYTSKENFKCIHFLRVSRKQQIFSAVFDLRQHYFTHYISKYIVFTEETRPSSFY